jgi:uncharacterized protein (TIGR02597 family)
VQPTSLITPQGYRIGFLQLRRQPRLGTQPFSLEVTTSIEILAGHQSPSASVAGEVFSSQISNYIATSASSPTDAYLALPRPTDYTLSELGLDNTSFAPSTSTSPGGRRDTLLVVNVNGSGANRAAVATYFRFNNNWYSTAASTVITNTAVLPAGAAIIIRKVRSDGNDRVWKNNLNVSL